MTLDGISSTTGEELNGIPDSYSIQKITQRQRKEEDTLTYHGDGAHLCPLSLALHRYEALVEI